MKDSDNLSYQWRHDNMDMVTEEGCITISGDTLTIQHFEKTHRGTYTCIVSTPTSSMCAEVTLACHG